MIPEHVICCYSIKGGTWYWSARADAWLPEAGAATRYSRRADAQYAMANVPRLHHGTLPFLDVAKPAASTHVR